MTKIFFDASVLIAAQLSPTGGSAKLCTYVKQKKCIGIISETVLLEMLGHTDKIKKSSKEIHDFIRFHSFIIREKVTIGEIAPYQHLIDQEDAHLIAGATLTKCAYLVTLDKRHILRQDIQDRFPSIKILSPKELLAIM